MLYFYGAVKHPAILAKTQYSIVAIFAKNIALFQYCNIRSVGPANAALDTFYTITSKVSGFIHKNPYISGSTHGDWHQTSGEVR
jgi:hypothetical protein